MSLIESHLKTWLDAYGQAWETRDADAAAPLFSEDAAYYETPFAEPARGREGVHAYWDRATKSHIDVSFSYDILAIAADTAIARWRAEYTRTTTGVHATLDGIFHLRFDDEGLCGELREWWHKSETPGS